MAMVHVSRIVKECLRWVVSLCIVFDSAIDFALVIIVPSYLLRMKYRADDDGAHTGKTYIMPIFHYRRCPINDRLSLFLPRYILPHNISSTKLRLPQHVQVG
eukprot:scaffold1340_cov18-Prasinocladus_malaysianus.AAC.1